jgi:hypothetical protein
VAAEQTNVRLLPQKPPPSEGKVVLTFKGGRDFDAPWIVIHAADLEEAHASVFGDNAVLLSALMEQVQKASQHFASQGKSSPASGGGAPQRQAPQGATEAPSWAGAAPAGYKYATGVKNGRTWHAFFPIERDSNLEKIWLNPPK